MKKKFYVLVLVLFVLFFSLTSWAAPLKEIYYTKKTTLAYPKNYIIRFSLWDDPTSGNMVWEEQKAMKLTSAKITTYLAGVNSFDDGIGGVPVDFSQQLWVQVDRFKGSTSTWIQVGTRDAFGLMPYALWSESVDGFIHNSGNTFIGENTGNLSMGGDYNTASGAYTFYNNTTGHSNTANGYMALRENRAGYYNTASGGMALYSNTNGNYNTAAGYRALYYNTGSNNTASGYYTLYSNTTGNGNTAYGLNALYSNTTGNFNTAIGYMTDVAVDPIYNATAIGYNALVDASNKVVIGNLNVTSIGGYAAWSNFSDIRSKTDIQDIGYGLDFISQLKPVSFKMKKGNGNTDFGFIAQDIEELLGGSYNLLDIGGGEERMLSLRYSQFIAPIVKAIQEQQAIIEMQEEQITTLEERLSRLESLMAGK